MKKITIGILLIMAFVISFALAMVINPKQNSTSAILFSFFAIVGISSGFGMWGWMIADLFKRTNFKYKWLWGAILLFHYPGAVIYFFSIVIPNEKRGQLKSSK